MKRLARLRTPERVDRICVRPEPRHATGVLGLRLPGPANLTADVHRLHFALHEPESEAIPSGRFMPAGRCRSRVQACGLAGHRQPAWMKPTPHPPGLPAPAARLQPRFDAAMGVSIVQVEGVTISGGRGAKASVSSAGWRIAIEIRPSLDVIPAQAGTHL